MEWLLHWLLARTDVRTVIFDTPPTIPGLSRAILSMAMRLPDHQDLAEDGGTPLELTKERTPVITWTPCLVASTDLQDMRAAERWLEGHDAKELDRILVLINRSERERDDLLRNFRRRLAGLQPSGAADSEAGGPDLYGGRLLSDPMVIRNASELRIFQGVPLPTKSLDDINVLVDRILRTEDGADILHASTVPAQSSD